MTQLVKMLPTEKPLWGSSLEQEIADLCVLRVRVQAVSQPDHIERGVIDMDLSINQGREALGGGQTAVVAARRL
jgi:hypothetical protein